MPRNNNLTRRALLAGVATTLAAPALGQIKGAFDKIGPDADLGDLIDQVWDPKRQAVITVRELIDQLEQAPIILIGERHGFAPHQDREAFILKALADRGRYPTLALEMLEPAQEPIIEAYRARNPEYARGLGIALDWANSGWPDWSFYEPVFDAAFVAKLPIVGADLTDQDETIELRNSDLLILEKFWFDHANIGHCYTLSENEAARMARTQVVRDVHFSEVVSQASINTQGAILLTGASHIVSSFGLPNMVHEATSSNPLRLSMVDVSDFGALRETLAPEDNHLLFLTQDGPKSDACNFLTGEGN